MMSRSILTIDAELRCSHLTGTVQVKAQQKWVTVEARALLVQDDPEGRAIAGCPVAPPNKLCTTTLSVEAGYSALVRVGGRPVCLDTLTGSTDGTLFPARYGVAAPGQAWVKADS